jgi:hypothetical protein
MKKTWTQDVSWVLAASLARCHEQVNARSSPGAPENEAEPDRAAKKRTPPATRRVHAWLRQEPLRHLAKNEVSDAIGTHSTTGRR